MTRVYRPRPRILVVAWMASLYYASGQAHRGAEYFADLVDLAFSAGGRCS